MTNEEFSRIIDETKAVVLSAIERHLAPDFRHALDDVAQETYVRAYKSLEAGKFRGDSALSSWLYSIARNESLRMNRKLGRDRTRAVSEEDELNGRDPLGDIADESTLANPAGEASMEADVIRELMARMPEKYSGVLKLQMQGYKEKEIASRLSLSPGTVKSRGARGRDMLARLYNEAEGNHHERKS